MPTVSAATRTETRLRVSRPPGGGRVRVEHEAYGGPEHPVIRPVLLDSGPAHARVSLVPEGALLLAGDAVDLTVEVGPGVTLVLVEPAGTVAYDMRGDSARWRVRLDVGEGARLVWHGEPFVVAAGSSVTRSVRASLGVGARLALRETLVLGRHGELAGRLRQELLVDSCDGTPVLAEGLDVEPGPPGLQLGGRRVVGSVLLAGADLPELSGAPGARLDLESGGTLVRLLADEAHLAVPDEAWRAAVAAVRG